MKHLVGGPIIVAFALMSGQTVSQVLAQANVPSVFLNERLWTSGIASILAAYLLWQAWFRESILRNETQKREERMATRISKLEDEHATSLQSIVQTTSMIGDCSKRLEAIQVKTDANCQACESRRHEILSKLESLRGQQ